MLTVSQRVHHAFRGARHVSWVSLMEGHMRATEPMVTRSAVVGPDVRLEYVETGDPTGLPVVFLHGVTDSWTSFEGTMERLPESIRAIAVSQRGHGNSSRPEHGYLMEDFSGDLLRF